MKTIEGTALIQEKEHNFTKYKIEIVEYDTCPDERFYDIACDVCVKMKFLWFWITIWRETAVSARFKTIDDYNDEVEYLRIKAEDILKALTD